jgi:hypothetical protein
MGEPRSEAFDEKERKMTESVRSAKSTTKKAAKKVAGCPGTHKANLDEGAMWPTAFPPKELAAKRQGSPRS